MYLYVSVCLCVCVSVCLCMCSRWHFCGAMRVTKTYCFFMIHVVRVGEYTVQLSQTVGAVCAVFDSLKFCRRNGKQDNGRTEVGKGLVEAANRAEPSTNRKEDHSEEGDDNDRMGAARADVEPRPSAKTIKDMGAAMANGEHFVGCVLPAELLDGGCPSWLAAVDVHHGGAQVEGGLRQFVREWSQLRAVDRAKLEQASADEMIHLPLYRALSAVTRAASNRVPPLRQKEEGLGSLQRHSRELPFGGNDERCGWCGGPGRQDSRFCSARCAEELSVLASSAGVRFLLLSLSCSVLGSDWWLVSGV